METSLVMVMSWFFLFPVFSRTMDEWVMTAAFNGSAAERQRIGIAEKVWIPVGRGGTLHCRAVEVAEQEGQQVNQMKWIKLSAHTQPLVVYPLPQQGQWLYHMSKNRTLFYLLNVQSYDEGYFDCHVFLSSGQEWTSRVQLIAQDCGEGEDEDLSVNRRDPCLHGKCQLAQYDDLPLMYVKCVCMARFTGVFCDVSNGNFPLHYIAIIIHVVVFVMGFVYLFCCSHGAVEGRCTKYYGPKKQKLPVSPGNLKSVAVNGIAKEE